MRDTDYTRSIATSDFDALALDAHPSTGPADLTRLAFATAALPSIPAIIVGAA